jgi:hypothetical protein
MAPWGPSNPRLRAGREPLYDINPLTGALRRTLGEQGIAFHVPSMGHG